MSANTLLNQNLNSMFGFLEKQDEFFSSLRNSQSLNTMYNNINVIDKISPFEVEDLDRIYNNARFPNRERRSPKIKKKYNATANVLIVCAQKLVAESNFKKGEANRVSKRMAGIIGIPVSSMKTKIFQLNSYIELGENKQISLGLIKAHKKFINVSGYDLRRVFENHKSYLSIEKALNELVIKNLKSSLF